MNINITEQLMALDPTLKAYNEGQWGHDNPWSIGFHSFNDAGIECETGEFLYSMVKMLQPERVLETGTHWGIGASYMGMGLKHNGKGHLDTIEFDPQNHARAVQRIATLRLNNEVTCHLMDVAQFPATAQYDLILLDTEPQTRFGELVRFFHALKPGGFVFIHDLHRHMAQVDEVHPDHPETPYWPWGALPEEIKELVRNDQLRPFHFSTPRGLTGFYKPTPNDYNWAK